MAELYLQLRRTRAAASLKTEANVLKWAASELFLQTKREG
jgi:hypothetical protein